LEISREESIQWIVAPERGAARDAMGPAENDDENSEETRVTAEQTD
jgi:hypothetical protein